MYFITSFLFPIFLSINFLKSQFLIFQGELLLYVLHLRKLSRHITWVMGTGKGQVTQDFPSSSTFEGNQHLCAEDHLLPGRISPGKIHFKWSLVFHFFLEFLIGFPESTVLWCILKEVQVLLKSSLPSDAKGCFRNESDPSLPSYLTSREHLSNSLSDILQTSHYSLKRTYFCPQTCGDKRHGT